MALIILAGFTRPNLQTQSRSIYRFDRYSGAALKTLSGGLFAVTVGFRSTVDSPRVAGSHHTRAQALLDQAEAAVAGLEGPGVEISVARIYVEIQEVTLSVEVKDADTLEQTRDQFIARLRASNGVAFAGEPKKASVE